MYYEFAWQTVFSGQYLQWIMQGIKTSLSLMLSSSILLVLFGCLLTIGQLSKNRIARFVSLLCIEISRNIPTLILLFMFYFVIPEVLPNNIKSIANTSPVFNYWSAVIGLSISSCGYFSEIIRGGILSVPKEQIIVAQTLGHSQFSIWRYIILPQAIRNCFPPMISRIIHNAKNTSLALTISVREIVWATKQIESLTFRGIETTIIATIFFLIINSILGGSAIFIERYFFYNKEIRKE